MKKLLIPVLSILFFSCSSKLSPDHKWENKKWVLMEILDSPVQLSGTEKDAHIIFNKKEQRFTGSGGCNRINGSYSMDTKGNLSFGQTLSTKMSCPDMAFEDKFLAQLAGVTSYELKEGKLVMKKGKKKIFVFMKQ